MGANTKVWIVVIVFAGTGWARLVHGTVHRHRFVTISNCRKLYFSQIKKSHMLPSRSDFNFYCRSVTFFHDCYMRPRYMPSTHFIINCIIPNCWASNARSVDLSKVIRFFLESGRRLHRIFLENQLHRIFTWFTLFELISGPHMFDDFFYFLLIPYKQQIPRIPSSFHYQMPSDDIFQGKIVSLPALAVIYFHGIFTVAFKLFLLRRNVCILRSAQTLRYLIYGRRSRERMWA